MKLPTNGDRQQLQTLINSEMEQPTALTIDFTMGGRLFWADVHKNVIESCKPDGSDRTTMLTDTGTLYNKLVNYYTFVLQWLESSSSES